MLFNHDRGLQQKTLSTLLKLTGPRRLVLRQYYSRDGILQLTQHYDMPPQHHHNYQAASMVPHFQFSASYFRRYTPIVTLELLLSFSSPFCSYFFLALVRASFMEETPDSKEGIIVGDLTGKLHEFLTESDTETGQFSFEEEMIEEVMQELYKEIACSPVTGPASSPGIPLPSSSSPVSPLFIDKGNNGSCGASVSDSASTVMAGISIAGGLPETEKGGSDDLVGFGVGSEAEKEKMEGCDGGDLDDEWLGRVLSWSQLESRQWF